MQVESSILLFVHRRSRSTEPRSLAQCLDLGTFRLAPGLATMGLRLKGPEIRTWCYFIGASTGAFRRKGGSRGQAFLDSLGNCEHFNDANAVVPGAANPIHWAFPPLISAPLKEIS